MAVQVFVLFLAVVVFSTVSIIGVIGCFELKLAEKIAYKLTYYVKGGNHT